MDAFKGARTRRRNCHRINDIAAPKRQVTGRSTSRAVVRLRKKFQTSGRTISHLLELCMREGNAKPFAWTRRHRRRLRGGDEIERHGAAIALVARRNKKPTGLRSWSQTSSNAA
jgi:hypothetical protein